jgi:Spy/CpxP family protein refolding chaperone
MKKERFYAIIIIALLLLNFGVLGYLWMGGRNNHMHPPRDGRGEGPAGFIIERLQLDEQQQQAFQKLRDAHHTKADELKEQSKQFHDALFVTLTDAHSNQGQVDSLMSLIAQNDHAKEELNYTHFKELKTILKPEQYKLYDEFIGDIARRFGPPPRGPRGEGPPPMH